MNADTMLLLNVLLLTVGHTFILFYIAGDIPGTDAHDHKETKL